LIPSYAGNRGSPSTLFKPPPLAGSMPKRGVRRSGDDPPSEEPRTYIVSFHIPKALLDALDRLVEMGVFNNRSEAIRTALFNLLREHRDVLERRQMMLGYR